MDQYLLFAKNHLFLVTAFFVLTGMLIYSFFSARLRGFAGMAPAQAVNLINHENAVVLDVREENEFLGGHIINAVHVPLGFLKDRIKDLEKYKEQPIIVSCRSGQRSMSACATLKKNGFAKIYNLTGGVTAWQSDNLPLVKK